MATYKADVTFPSLGEAVEVLSTKHAAIANRLLGPLVSFEGMSAGSYLEIARYLPAGVETEVTLEGGSQSLEEARTRLGRLQKNDRVMGFVADHGAVEVRIDDNGVAAIVCDFTTPMNSADESKPIPFDTLLNVTDRMKIAAAVLQALGANQKNANELSHRLVHGLGVEAGYQATRDPGTGFMCKVLVGDDRLKINHSFSILPENLPPDAVLDAVLKAVPGVRAFKGWKAKLYGQTGRIEPMIAGRPDSVSSVAFGATAPRQKQLLRVEQGDRERWEEELRNAVIPEPSLKAILDKESTLEYRRLTLKWVNAGSWIVDSAGKFGAQDQEMFADNSLEISRSRRRPVNLYISVGDSQPKSRIKTALESTLDVRLKSVM